MNVKKIMMCDEVSAYLSRYQDNELDPAARAQIDTHLQACAACREKLLQLEAVTTRVKQLPVVEAGPYFTTQVMGKIMEKEKKSRWLAWLPLPSSSPSLLKAVYTVVFIIFLLLGVWVNMKTGSPASNFPGSGDTGQDRQQELQMVRVLVESQDLSLINVQDKTLAMLYNGNGGTHAK